MANPSVIITVTKRQTPDTGSAATVVADVTKQNNDETTAAAEDTLKALAPMPDTKAELMALYQIEPLPINNSVNSKELEQVAQQRLELYNDQLRRTEIFYTVKPALRPTYMVQALKPQFVEYQQFQMARALDQRGIVDLDNNERMWQQLHIVDDLIADVVRHMPAQQPVGWQLISVNNNYLKLPTVGRLRDENTIADQASLNSYVLGHFGVMSYTYDRAYFIGHVLGYLFCCYYFAHLSISYGVTPLPENTVPNYDFSSLETAKMVRLLHSVDVHCKRRIYQLAVLCARLSCYQIDKYIEKMLIAEVNEFDKKQQIAHLDVLLNRGIMPEMPDMLNMNQVAGNSDGSKKD